jgi:transposase
MDVSKDWIAVATLEPDRDTPVVDKIFNDEVSVRRFVRQFRSPARLAVCYEAGPTGYELHRLLASMGVACDVVAPSLIPKAPGERVKTDRRDARKLVRLHRAGELTAIRVPTPAEEAVRDGCRARADIVDDLSRARKRLGAFLLRHNHIWRDGSTWTVKHHLWLQAQRFDERALNVTFGHYLGTVEAREAELEAIEAELRRWLTDSLFADQIARLCAYRGVADLGVLTLASEVCDWRRFPTPATFMGFCGLVVSEYSSGASVKRGHLTKTGNAHVRSQLVESAWAYQHRASVGAELRRRQEGLDRDTVARAWAAQLRLCSRYRNLLARKNNKPVVIAAVARELAGFLWAEMVA